MKEQEEWERKQCVSGKSRMGCNRRRASVSRGLWGVHGDVLRERNLLEVTEQGFLSSSFEYQAMFETEGSNLRFKIVNRIYCTHDTVRSFTTELVVSLSSSQHGSHTLGKKGIVRG